MCETGHNRESDPGEELFPRKRPFSRSLKSNSNDLPDSVKIFVPNCRKKRARTRQAKCRCLALVLIFGGRTVFVQAQGLPIVPVAHALKSFTVNTWALSWIKYALVISFGFHWLEDGIKIRRNGGAMNNGTSVPGWGFHGQDICTIVNMGCSRGQCKAKRAPASPIGEAGALSYNMSESAIYWTAASLSAPRCFWPCPVRVPCGRFPGSARRFWK